MDDAPIACAVGGRSPHGDGNRRLRLSQPPRSRSATAVRDGDPMAPDHDLLDDRSTDVTAEVVIVGGGIVGGALASVLSEAGLDVCVLERDDHHRDRNKGENLMPWGWADAHRLGLTTVLDGAAGRPNPVWETVDPDGLLRPVPVGELHPDAPGTYSVSHPGACRALAEFAAANGTSYRFGAADVSVTPGTSPTVTWAEHGRAHRARPRLVIGADGRTSAVRRQLGLRLHRTERTHLISSVLVEGTRDLGDHVHVAGWDERLLLVIPLEGDRARLYVVTRDETFGGTAGAARLVEVSQTAPAPAPERWAGTPVGPCATYGGEDAWVDRPVGDGCVLVGDAAGYNSPIIGQGLALAMRDARLVSEALLSTSRWSAELFEHYVAERAERLRRVRFTAQLWARARLAPDDQVVALRDEPLFLPLLRGIFAGFDDADPAIFSDATVRELLGHRASGLVSAAG